MNARRTGEMVNLMARRDAHGDISLVAKVFGIALLRTARSAVSRH